MCRRGSGSRATAGDSSPRSVASRMTARSSRRPGVSGPACGCSTTPTAAPTLTPKTAGMVICPCSMGTVAAIAHGTSRSLIERAADVILKERRTLILVPRETPLSLIHLRNLTLATEAGAVVLPAAPGFYQKPQQVRDLVDFVVQRVLDHLGLDINLVKRWEGK